MGDHCERFSESSTIRPASGPTYRIISWLRPSLFLILSVLVGCFLFSNPLLAERTYDEAVGNFVGMTAYYRCPQGKQQTFPGSGFALGTYGDKVYLATALHVLFTLEENIRVLATTPCTYQLEISWKEQQIQNLILRKEEVEEFGLFRRDYVKVIGVGLPALTLDPGEDDIALLVIDKSRFGSWQPVAFNSLCLQEPYAVDLRALCPCAGGALKLADVEGPLAPAPLAQAANAKIEKWSLKNDLVVEGTSGSPVFRSLKNGDCSDLAFVGVIQWRPTVNAAGTPVPSTPRFNMGQMRNLRTLIVQSGMATLDSPWLLARAEALVAKIRAFYLKGSPPSPAELKKLISIHSELKRKENCCCHTTALYWEGALELMKGQSAPEDIINWRSKLFARDVAEAMVASSARGDERSDILRTSWTLQAYPPEYRRVAGDLIKKVSEADALSLTSSTQGHGKHVAAVICGTSGDCKPTALVRFARGEFQQFAAQDAAAYTHLLRELETVSSDIPMGVKK